MIYTLLIIITTIWVTCSVIYVSKALSRPFSSSRSFLILADLFFAPYFIVDDIVQEWKENKQLREKYK